MRFPTSLSPPCAHGLKHSVEYFDVHTVHFVVYYSYQQMYNIYILKFICVYVYICVCVCVYTHTQISIEIYIYIHAINIDIYIYIYI